jgi:hypothetical protein
MRSFTILLCHRKREGRGLGIGRNRKGIHLERDLEVAAPQIQREARGGYAGLPARNWVVKARVCGEI